eukprot:Gb_23302 [translate_table: standard]
MQNIISHLVVPPIIVATVNAPLLLRMWNCAMVLQSKHLILWCLLIPSGGHDFSTHPHRVFHNPIPLLCIPPMSPGILMCFFLVRLLSTSPESTSFSCLPLICQSLFFAVANNSWIIGLLLKYTMGVEIGFEVYASSDMHFEFPAMLLLELLSCGVIFPPPIAIMVLVGDDTGLAPTNQMQSLHNGIGSIIATQESMPPSIKGFQDAILSALEPDKYGDGYLRIPANFAMSTCQHYYLRIANYIFLYIINRIHFLLLWHPNGSEIPANLALVVRKSIDTSQYEEEHYPFSIDYRAEQNGAFCKEKMKKNSRYQLLGDGFARGRLKTLMQELMEASRWNKGVL